MYIISSKLPLPGLFPLPLFTISTYLSEQCPEKPGPPTINSMYQPPAIKFGVFHFAPLFHFHPVFSLVFLILPIVTFITLNKNLESVFVNSPLSQLRKSAFLLSCPCLLAHLPLPRL